MEKDFSIPAAIIVAGALIAGAIYFSNVAKPPVTTTSQTAGITATATPEPTVGAIRPVTDQDHVRGANNSKITLIEYSDLECPFCKSFQASMQQLLKEYPNDVRWVYRHLPLESLHQQAPTEALAVECAAEQGKFWELTDLIYQVTTSNDGLDLKTMPALAKQAGVANAAQFEQCWNSKKYNDRLAADRLDAEAAGALNFGTPFSVLVTADGKKIPFPGAQPYNNLKQAVASLL